MRVLQKTDVNEHVVKDINELLKLQHSKAREIERRDLIDDHMAQTKIVVAIADNDQIIGMGALVWNHVISHSYASLHNLIIRDGFDETVTAQRIVELLLTDIYSVRFIEAGSGIKSPDIVKMLQALGFDKKERIRYRKKIF